MNELTRYMLNSAALRADPPLGREFPICPKLSLPAVPFRLWALITHEICDVMKIRTRQRAILWNEYKLDMIRMGFSYEHSKLFGLWEN